ncbi:MAG: XrtA system polysaccharide chain length determinant [Pseudomonadota bacterium]
MDNPIESFVANVRRIAKQVLKRRWLALGVGTAVAVAGAVAVQFAPNRYQATARIFVDTQTVLKPLMTGLTYQPDIDQQVSMLARTLISRANVEKLLDRPELNLGEADPSKREATALRLMERIKIVPTASNNLFEITYRGPSPADAKNVVQATVDLFMNSGAGAKKQDSKEAARFIDEQIRTYEVKLTEAETRLKDFKVRNFGVSGVSNQDYFLRISTLGEEVSKLRVELNAAEQARNTYRRELESEDPQLPAELQARGAGGEGDSRLEEQRRRLDELLRRFTDAHPDVLSTRRTIAEIEAENRARKEAASRLGIKTGKAATSPVYQKLRVSLAENEVLVASLRSQLGAQQARLDQTRALAGRLPQVEAELAQLNRDYDVIRKNYEVLVARRESASLGERLDESSQLAEFRLIEPARAAPQPVFPARIHFAVLAVLASLTAGVVAAVLADLMHPTFEDTTALRQASGRPVLGSVSLQGTASGAAAGSVPSFVTLVGLLIAVQLMWAMWMATRAPVQ